MFKELGLVGYLRVLSLITFFCAVNVQVFGQCGVYFKRAATWSFPVSKVYLDYAKAHLRPEQIDVVDETAIPGYSGVALQPENT